ncbi:2-hydroxyacid dehydrogenase [Halomonas daqiaonensis]|uniref:Phosphogluconate 2-dehydrogenase n=1 Tax=Halomonas daqiaonensis TaxID=650850 RepID=A0A1H7TQ01_9GAMM|nr:D-glycerate dehydrogenase [Halomonas daqiaonensis]SEL86446.1 phosphogluconate 2-dehydrogenase [Halomonas daqiaonensis]
MKKRILAYGRLNDEQLAQLGQDFEVQTFPDLASADDPAFRSALPDAHGLIGASVAITPELLEEAPNLEAIATISVGYDKYPVEELTRRGILLCNTPDVLTETTADTGFLLIMATARRAVELAELIKRGEWQTGIGPEHFGSDVHGKTLGMIGFGRIGAAVARRGALGFGMRILYTKASPKPELEVELGAERHEMDSLLAEADIICVTVPLTAETEHLIGEREFALMKPTAIFVNIARGQVVNEAALIEALEMGRIRAAGLDVFEQEPLSPESPLPHMTNVVALPHIGSATHETRHAMAQRAVDNLVLALRGEHPINLVNEAAWRSV